MLIETICYIVITVCGVGMFWALYLMYLDWLWGWYDSPVERPVWTVCDCDDREIARFD